MAGKKRSHAETEAVTNTKFIHPERRETAGNGVANKPPKAKRQKVTDGNMSWVKKRARDIERRFEHDVAKVPANVKKDLERELAAHKQRIADDRNRKLRSKMIGKYHMVRFFERKKAQRMAKQLRQQLNTAEDPEEVAKLNADLHIAEVDNDYAIYYPFMERYISVYPPAKSEPKNVESTVDEKRSAARALLNAPRPPMWTMIEEARKQGKSALEKLQNRVPEPESDAKPAAKQRKKANAGASSEAKEKAATTAKAKASSGEAKADGDNDGDSDGGFFEED
ncbi:hypothetical protein B0T17DRAFT_507175 [Bombardia bombarda]|uniref:rRNA-processing protein EFG1 n=1 Tax=Bombardia bombarda TaxID=252184 RepID=A0AA39XBQ0_9PEZI|nr:hypothetical protein B0T17DRAFT_507175 [Bombardia bombarda]